MKYYTNFNRFLIDLDCLLNSVLRVAYNKFITKFLAGDVFEKIFMSCVFMLCVCITRIFRSSLKFLISFMGSIRELRRYFLTFYASYFLLIKNIS